LPETGNFFEVFTQNDGMHVFRISTCFISEITEHTVKSTDFWDVMPCSLTLQTACFLILAGYLLGIFFDPEYGGSMLLQNFSGLLLLDYATLYPRRQ
jgi:hypothetical protein